MPLTIVNRTQVSKNPTADKVAHIRGEVTSLLEEKLEELRQESEAVKATMQQALTRLGTQGFEIELNDLRSGRWHRVSSEVKLLQEVMSIIEAVQ